MTDERAEAPPTGGELAQLTGYLDFQRATLARKSAGLDAEQLGRTLAPSDMTLGGMLKHCALNEVTWFCHRFAGEDEGEPWDSVDWELDWDWDWHSAADNSPEQLRELWQASVDRARRAIAGAGPDELATIATRSGLLPNLRWILLHMIEEYARHNGHADLLRESIDGATGE